MQINEAELIITERLELRELIHWYTRDELVRPCMPVTRLH